MVGDGPERERLNAMIVQGGVGDCVTLEGWKSQEDVAELLSESDVFAFPTIREAGGNVILEAMSSGLPCIVPAYGGPAQLVDDDTGIRIPLTTREQLINDYEQAMLSMVVDDDRRQRMSQAARNKALQEFDWAMKGKRLYQLCSEVVNSAA